MVNRQSVVLIIKDCLKLAGIENQNFSGHSLRSGFTKAIAAGLVQ